MLEDSDPMKGYWDRAIADKNEGEINALASRILYFIQNFGLLSIEEFKQHSIEDGYGSEETMKRLLP
jgi:hypothetical protein